MYPPGAGAVAPHGPIAAVGAGRYRLSGITVILPLCPPMFRLTPMRWGLESWNHIGRRETPGEGCVTYWMNRLQAIRDANDAQIHTAPLRGRAT